MSELKRKWVYQKELVYLFTEEANKERARQRARLYYFLNCEKERERTRLEYQAKEICCKVVLFLLNLIF